MSKAIKRLNLQEGQEALERLVAWDYGVVAFSDIHYRINGRLDVWPSTKRYYDMRTRQKGTYHQLESFVKGLLPPPQ